MPEVRGQQHGQSAIGNERQDGEIISDKGEPRGEWAKGSACSFPSTGEIQHMKIRYSSNNSGGYWWLSDEQWKALEKAGWEVEWGGWNKRCATAEEAEPHRWLGALARSATKDFPSKAMAIAEWEHITGESEDDAGCPCCGNPHNFYEESAE